MQMVESSTRSYLIPEKITSQIEWKLYQVMKVYTLVIYRYSVPKLYATQAHSTPTHHITLMADDNMP